MEAFNRPVGNITPVTKLNPDSWAGMVWHGYRSVRTNSASVSQYSM